MSTTALFIATSAVINGAAVGARLEVFTDLGETPTFHLELLSDGVVQDSTTAVLTADEWDALREQGR